MTNRTARTSRSPDLTASRHLAMRPTVSSGALRALGVLLYVLLALAAANTSAFGAEQPSAGAGEASPEASSSPPASEYQALPVCHAPAPGHAACLALALAPRTPAARTRAHSVGAPRPHAALGSVARAAECPIDYASSCFTPEDLRAAYFPGEQPDAPVSVAEPSSTQTIALVDAYNDPKASADLRVYSQELGLPELPECTPTARRECFEKVNQRGETTGLPVAVTQAEKEEAEGWALETATDIEAAHAVCQNCRIVLVEAENSGYGNLATAENTAVGLGANEVSNSWGGSEAELTEAEISAFEHPGVAITASAGDDGYLNWDQWKTEPLAADEPDYPASSPGVVAIGGTRLTLSAGAWQSETVWNEDHDGKAEGAAGGGCSLRFEAPVWQLEVADWPAVGCEDRRAVADISADADPTTGVAVYDSVPYPSEGKTETLGWVPIGGTSLASPIVAAMFALAGGAHGVPYPAATLYSHLGSSLLHDVAPKNGVSAGGNGECDADYSDCGGSMKPLSPFDCGVGAWICNAAVGYDGPTGVGTPNGIAAFRRTGEGAGGENPESKGGSGSKSSGQEGPSSIATNPGQTTTGAEGVAPGETGHAEPLGSTSKPALSSKVAIRLSHLELTLRALDAIAHSRPRISQIALAFTLNAATRIRITLSKEVRVRGRIRSIPEPGSFALAVAEGRDHLHLRGSGALAPGRYRVTFTPAGGGARSLMFVVR